MSLEQRAFGTAPCGTAIDEYTLTNAQGFCAKVMTYGAILTSMHTPDRDGRFAEITLGFDDLDGYLRGHPYFGAIVGRYAGRIHGPRFELDGVTHELAKTDGAAHLHGGINGFDKAVWKAVAGAHTQSNPSVILSYTSADGEEGYPGNLECAVTYTLTAENELRIDYLASTDKPTYLNLTNHAYWNLAGAGSGDVYRHEFALNAEEITVLDDNLIPTGDLQPVEGTPFDFRQPKSLGRDIAQLKHGYDTCFVLTKSKANALSLAAKVSEPITGRCLEVHTTQPTVVLYTGNYLSVANGDGTSRDGIRGAGGAIFKKHDAFCLEAEHYPNAPNRPEYPSARLDPGQTYRHSTIHRFSVN